MNYGWRSLVVSGFFLMSLEGIHGTQAAAQTLESAKLLDVNLLNNRTQALSHSLNWAQDSISGNAPTVADISKTIHLSTSSSTTKTSSQSGGFHPLQGLIHGISSIIGGVAHFVSSGVSSVVHAASSVVGGILRPIIPTISHVAGAVASGITSAINGFGNVVSGVGSVITGIGHAISTIPRTLGTVASLVVNGINLIIHSMNAPALLSPSAEVLAHSDGKVPVILVGGSFSNSVTMEHYYNILEKDGIPAYSPTLGEGNTVLDLIAPFLAANASVDTSARQLSDLVNKVEKQTGSSKVNLVGFSQGGLIVRDYMDHDSSNNVLTDVNLGGTLHGTTLSGVVSVINSLPKPLFHIANTVIAALVGQGQVDQEVNSPLLQALNSYPETKAGVHYLSIASNTDFIATPYQTSFLKPVPGADVTNIEVHSIPGAQANFDHLEYAVDPAVIKTVTKYIEDKGEPATAAIGTSFHTITTPSQKVITPAQKITPPAVDLLN